MRKAELKMIPAKTVILMAKSGLYLKVSNCLRREVLPRSLPKQAKKRQAARATREPPNTAYIIY